MFDKNPKWIAMAQDKVGHCYGFTGIPIFHHNSGRWIVPLGGECISMGMHPKTDNPESSLVIRPGMEEEVRAKQEEYYKEHRPKPVTNRGFELNQGDAFGDNGSTTNRTTSW